MHALKFLPSPNRCALTLGTYVGTQCTGWLGLLLAASLTACGGGNSTADLASTTANANNSDSAGTPSSTLAVDTPLLLTPGAYFGTLNSKEWVSIVVRSQQGSGAVSNFLSLYYNSTDPDIISGSGLIAGTTSASLSKVVTFQNTLATLRTGSGTLMKPSENAIKADINFSASGAELAKALSVVANMPSNYQYNTAATQSTVQGNWQGRWSYGIGSSDNFTLTISNQGAVSSAQFFQQDCRITQSTLVPNFDGTNLFVWNLIIPNATQCAFKNQALSGAAFVTASPVAGKTQRLYAVAVTPDGRGVSFKADR